MLLRLGFWLLNYFRSGRCTWLLKYSILLELGFNKCYTATETDSDLLSFIWIHTWDLYLYLLGCIAHLELDELFRILNSIKGFKLRQPQWSNTTLSNIDLRSGYHHIPIAKEDCHKSTFVREYGKFEFKRASFGISTCSDYLKSLMNKLFFDCDSFCIVYMDNLLVFSESEEEHLKHLEIIFEKFRNADLKLKLSKCQFWKKEIEYLGHLVSQEGIKVMPDKINTVLRIKPPSNVKEAKSALGIMGYVASFIPMYSEVVRHINRLTRKNVPFVWIKNARIV